MGSSLALVSLVADRSGGVTELTSGSLVANPVGAGMGSGFSIGLDMVSSVWVMKIQAGRREVSSMVKFGSVSYSCVMKIGEGILEKCWGEFGAVKKL